jgi:hypothetical protein
LVAGSRRDLIISLRYACERWLSTVFSVRGDYAVPAITELYREVRGDGPAVVLIMGATGDCGHFDQLVEPLADE